MLANANETFRLACRWFESMTGIRSLILLALQSARRMEDIAGYFHIFSVYIPAAGCIFMSDWSGT
jgi:hypothetical protein